MKKILITHNDLDGAGCAIIFKKAYPDIEIQHHDYKTINGISNFLLNNKSNYDHIFFADISPDEDVGMLMLDDPKFTIIDHHTTKGYLEGSQYFDINRCGAYLSYECIENNIIPPFISAINAWDIWDLESPFRQYGEDLNVLFGYYGMESFVNIFKDMRDLSNNEKLIIKVLHKIKQDYLLEKLNQSKILIDKEGNKYLEVYVGEKQSGLGNILEFDDIPDVEYLKCINLNDGLVSLYSLGFDVSKIAIDYGGGGHIRAAGYTLMK